MKERVNEIKYFYIFSQLSELVRDRHQAQARLKTAEDLLEAMRMENEILKKSQPGQQLISDSRHTTGYTTHFNFNSYYMQENSVISGA